MWLSCMHGVSEHSVDVGYMHGVAEPSADVAQLFAPSVDVLHM